MNVLITGIAGLLGSRFAEYLLTAYPEVNVIGIDDLSGGFRENVPTHSIFYNRDLNHPLDDIMLTHRPDIVYHFAAYAAECMSPFVRQFNYRNNLGATANVVNACIKFDVKRLVFTSTMAVYGENTPPFDETYPRRPVDPYGIAKAACENDIEVAGVQHGLDWCIVRPHNVYGRNQNIWDSYRNFIGIAMYKGIVGDPITVYGDGLQTRAFSEMTDCLEPLWNAGILPEASKQIINLGGITESTILDAAQIVSTLSGAPIIHLPPRLEVKHAYATWQKSSDILGFKHTVDIPTGIRNMWQWAIAQPTRPRFIWSDLELDKGLYPQWKPDALKDGYYKS